MNIYASISGYALLNLLTGAIVFGSSITIYYLGRNQLSAKLFSVLSATISIWCISIAVAVSTDQLGFMLFITKWNHFLGILITNLFLLFSFSYSHRNTVDRRLAMVLAGTTALFAAAIFLTDSIIRTAMIHPVLPFLVWEGGPLWILFGTYFTLGWLVGMVWLVNNCAHESNPSIQKGLKLIVIAFTIGVIPPSFLTIILPQLGIFEYYWLAPSSALIWILITAYSIVKHHLFNIRVIAVELIIFTLWMFILVRGVLSETLYDFSVQLILFVSTIILGILIIKKVFREIQQRTQFQNLANELKIAYSKLQTLNDTLEQKVAEQTVEIRRAYELEKRARRELEKLNDTKDQFIMITQHHLRTPVTSIRWSMEDLLKGTHGALAPGAQQAVENANVSVNRLIRIVDDFLSITALKVGSQILNIARGSMLPLVEDALSELRNDMEELRLKIDYSRERRDWPDVDIDPAKMREALLIILENAVRYNIPDGTISIRTSTTGGGFTVTVENTGIGFAPEDGEKIFKSLFYRGTAARTRHPIGMGIGLTVARAVVRAHHGDVTIESGGLDTGAKVMVRVPV